jgi:UDP-N-acetylmuramate dehydrogenase
MIKTEIKKICPQVKFKELLAKHTSLRIGGPAEYFVEVANRNELANLLKIAKKYNSKVFLLGAGTNVLVKDRGIKGIVIRLLGDFRKIQFKNRSVFVGAGVGLFQLLKISAEHNLEGIEFLAGIPGTVGGALVMNAGNPKEGIGNLVDSVKIMKPNGKIQIFKKKDLHFSYRRSNFPKGSLILSCWLRLKKSKKETIIKVIKERLKERWGKQPRGYSAGSVFKNPPDDYAGRLIEKAGLKGVKYGDAYISEKHANFILNRGKAKAKDVLYLIRKIKNTVKNKFGVDLELEIKILGN